MKALKWSLLVADFLALGAFGIALVGYAQALPPDVPLGMSMLAYVAPRMGFFAIVMALFNLSVLTLLKGVRSLESARLAALAMFGISGLLLVSVGFLFLLLVFFSFPQY